MKPNLTKSTLAFTFCCFISINLCFAQKPSKADYLSQYLYRYDHVGINIRNLQKSADWYKNVLGFHVLHKWKTTWMVGNKTMKIGLFQRPDAKKIDSLDNTIAITHFAFLTSEAGLKKIQQLLKMKNIPFDAQEDTGIAYSIFIYDPDGHQVEITTYHTQLPDSTAKQ